MTLPSSITSLVKQAHKPTENTHLCSHDGRGEGGLGVILRSSALQTLTIQFRFSSANGCHLALLTVKDLFQRNCCARTAYLEGNEGFSAYFSSSISPLSLCGIMSPLMGAWCLLLSSWSSLSYLVTSRNKHLFHQEKRWSQISGD